MSASVTSGDASVKHEVDMGKGGRVRLPADAPRGDSKARNGLVHAPEEERDARSTARCQAHEEKLRDVYPSPSPMGGV